MVGIAGVVVLPLLLAVVIAAAWADEPFFYFVREWYRTIRLVTPYYFHAWKAEAREFMTYLSGRLKVWARLATKRVPVLRVAQPLLER